MYTNEIEVNIEVGVPGHVWLVSMEEIEQMIEEHYKSLPPIQPEEKPKGKVCQVCKRDLPATTDYYHRRKTALDGLDPRCKVCKSEYDQELKRRRRENKPTW